MALFKTGERLTNLEARVKALELRLGESDYKSIDDVPATVEHAYTIREILKAAEVLARIHNTDPNSSEEVRAAAGSIIDGLQAMGRTQ